MCVCVDVWVNTMCRRVWVNTTYVIDRQILFDARSATRESAKRERERTRESE